MTSCTICNTKLEQILQLKIKCWVISLWYIGGDMSAIFPWSLCVLMFLCLMHAHCFSCDVDSCGCCCCCWCDCLQWWDVTSLIIVCPSLLTPPHSACSVYCQLFMFAVCVNLMLYWRVRCSIKATALCQSGSRVDEGTSPWFCLIVVDAWNFIQCLTLHGEVSCP